MNSLGLNRLFKALVTLFLFVPEVLVSLFHTKCASCTLLCIRPWDTEKSNESREIERKKV